MKYKIVEEPHEIEKKSMATIEAELNGRIWPEPEFSVIKRCIHTSADFDYADNIVYSKDAVKIGIEALKNGAAIVTDTKMAASGINKNHLKKHGCTVHCFVSDEDVVAEAKERGCTRSVVAMERGAKLGDNVIFAVGNAPTALISLYDMIKAGKIKPALVIGVPVGFVNVVESKEMIMEAGVPYIVARGRKGGSNIAAAICNAMVYSLGRDW